MKAKFLSLGLLISTLLAALAFDGLTSTPILKAEPLHTSSRLVANSRDFRAHPRTVRYRRRSKKHEAAIIGGSAAGGAVIGALAGGKKGAAIGAAAGAVGGTAYDLATRKKKVRTER